MKHLLLNSLLLLFLLVCVKALTAQPYTIPVVFHILHQGGPENISDSQIIDAMRILNDDYNKRNADTVNVLAQYQSNIADMQVNFQLATLDPNGNATSGIDRIYTPYTFSGNDSTKLNQWNPNRYLNIWVVAVLQSGVAGYAYYPWTASNRPEVDGVIIQSNKVGSIGTSTGTSGRVLTHEIGHYLCLLHPSGWGDSNCADNDSVADTHDSKGYLTCSDTVPALQCIPGIPTNYQTFMDYSHCSCMFTNGQKARVYDCLNNYRDSLIMPSNLVHTGLPGAILLPPKAPALSVVPNPFNNLVRVSGLQSGSYSICVFDIWGRVIVGCCTRYTDNSYLNLDLSSVLTKGIYILKVTDSNGESSALRLIRE